jgi:copper resistance protein B
MPGVATGQIADDQAYTFVLFDQLEFAPARGGDPVRYDVVGWHGGDFDRVWFKGEGEQATGLGGPGEAEFQVLYGRLISAFWDLQAGVRIDARYGPGDDAARAHLVVGIQGLAPYWFELEPALFVSQKGDVSARLTAEYDMLFTQRLIGQPRLEINGAVQEVAEFGIGPGLNELELGWRLRYELRRELAPYLGVSWLRKFGGTADLARAEGAEADDLSVVAGLRAWF